MTIAICGRRFVVNSTQRYAAANEAHKCEQSFGGCYCVIAQLGYRERDRRQRAGLASHQTLLLIREKCASSETSIGRRLRAGCSMEEFRSEKFPGARAKRKARSNAARNK